LAGVDFTDAKGGTILGKTRFTASAATTAPTSAPATSAADARGSRQCAEVMAAVPSAKQIDAAKFDAYLNGAYQADREAYLDGWHRALMFGVIVLGASAVIDIMPAWARTIATMLTAVLAAADLVLDLSVRARTASFLRKGYFEVAAKLEERSISPQGAHAEMLRLAAEEEPPYKAAHAVAENWATTAVFGSSKPLPCRVGPWRRLTRNAVHYHGHDFSAC
jgi:hypothetical protein